MQSAAKYDIISVSDEAKHDGGKGSGIKGHTTPKDGKITTPSASIVEVYDEVGTGKRVKVIGPVGKPYIFAGSGGKSALRAAETMTKKYGGDKSKWQHGRQNMIIEVDGKQVKADVHYFYEPSVGYVEQRTKRGAKEGKK